MEEERVQDKVFEDEQEKEPDIKQEKEQDEKQEKEQDKKLKEEQDEKQEKELDEKPEKEQYKKPEKDHYEKQEKDHYEKQEKDHYEKPEKEHDDNPEKEHYDNPEKDLDKKPEKDEDEKQEKVKMKTVTIASDRKRKLRKVKAQRAGAVLFFLVCLVLCAGLFQPMIGTYDDRRVRTMEEEGGRPMKTKFYTVKQEEEVSGYSEVGVVDVGLTLREDSVNETWALGFSIRNNDTKIMYVWFYHDNSNPDIQEPVDTLFIACHEKGREQEMKLGNIWESAWEPNNERFLRFEMTHLNLNLYPTPVQNRTEDSYTKDCNLPDSFNNYTMQTVCWSPTAESRNRTHCPSLVMNCRRKPAKHFFITLITNLGAFATAGCIIGCSLAALWIRHVNLNLYKLIKPGVKAEPEKQQQFLWQ